MFIADRHCASASAKRPLSNRPRAAWKYGRADSCSSMSLPPVPCEREPNALTLTAGRLGVGLLANARFLCEIAFLGAAWRWCCVPAGVDPAAQYDVVPSRAKKAKAVATVLVDDLIL